MNKMVKILGLSLFFLCYFLLSCWFLFYVSSSSCATKIREKMKILICIMWNLHCLVEWQLTLLSFMACHFLIHLRSGWHWLDFFIASVGIELWVWYFCIQLIWSLTVVILRTIEISTVAVNNWDQIFLDLRTVPCCIVQEKYWEDHPGEAVPLMQPKFYYGPWRIIRGEALTPNPWKPQSSWSTVLEFLPFHFLFLSMILRMLRLGNT